MMDSFVEPGSIHWTEQIEVVESRDRSDPSLPTALLILWRALLPRSGAYWPPRLTTSDSLRVRDRSGIPTGRCGRGDVADSPTLEEGDAQLPLLFDSAPHPHVHLKLHSQQLLKLLDKHSVLEWFGDEKTQKFGLELLTLAKRYDCNSYEILEGYEERLSICFCCEKAAEIVSKKVCQDCFEKHYSDEP